MNLNKKLSISKPTEKKLDRFFREERMIEEFPNGESVIQTSLLKKIIKSDIQIHDLVMNEYKQIDKKIGCHRRSVCAYIIKKSIDASKKTKHQNKPVVAVLNAAIQVGVLNNEAIDFMFNQYSPTKWDEEEKQMIKAVFVPS